MKIFFKQRTYYKYIIFIISFFWSANCLAQTTQNTFNLNYTPASPNAVSLGKFGEYPVSLSTGVPTISVPFFNYKGVNNGLSLGISLDYHAGGIRVEEIASNVGMGWALNAGGVISRTVRSLPDDQPVYGYLVNYPLPQPSYTVGGANIALNNYLNNAIDSEQDEFSFNFDGHAGKFILNGNGTPSLITQEALKIQPLYSSGASALPFTGFIITDESGIKYVFRDAETSIAKMGSYVSLVHYTSSWYMSSIINPTTRDTIKFTYNTAANNVYNLGSESSQNTMNEQGDVSLNTIYSDPSGSTTSIVVKKIKSIKLPDNTEFDFYYNPVSRCDLKQDSTLTEIRKKNTLTGQYKSFKLYQSYISNFGTIYAYTPAPCDLSDNLNSTTLRLRLDSVKECSSTGALPAYKFSYNDGYFLPATDSRSQDFWGFYNGAINRTSHLVPQYLYTDNSGHSYMLPGADRRVDSNAVSACTLTKMTYPTGGSSQFDYEANRAGDNKLIFKQLQTNSIVFDDNNGTPATSKVFTINQQPNNQALNINFLLSSWCPQTATSCSFVFKIKSVDNAITYQTVQFAHSEIGVTKTVPLNLPNGQYQLTWQFSDPVSCTCSDEFGYSVSYVTAVSDSTQMGGGIRIKKVTSYDGINHTNDLIKQYKYVDGLGKSSGFAAVLPEFSYSTSSCYIIHQGTDTFDPTIYGLHYYFNRTATTNYPLTYSNGGINYARVEVDDIGPVNNGKEIDYFTSYNESPPQSNSGTMLVFPFVPLQTLSWKIGLLKRREIYNSTGQLLKKDLNAYNIFTDWADTLASYKVGITSTSCGDVLFPPTYSINKFYLYYGHTDKIVATNVDYMAAGDSVVTNTYYTYNQNYYTLSKELTIDSKKDSIATYHYYPFDYNISGSVFNAMRDSNMIAKPVSNEVWKYLTNKYYLVSADATNYGLFGSSYLPSTYYTLKTTVPVDPATIGSFNPATLVRVPALYEQKVNMSSYDSKANPVLINQYGLRTAYIWDLNKEFPIAKISNADSLAVAYTSFEADGTGNWTVGSATRNSTAAITGTKSYSLASDISKAGLTATKTYIVSYWTQNSNPYTIAGTITGYPIKGATNKGWTYYEHRITGQTTIALSGSGSIDELRLYPSDAQMTTYTYDLLTGLTSSTNAKNEITYYEYDSFQRLMNVKDKDGNIVKHTDYHYQQ